MTIKYIDYLLDDSIRAYKSSIAISSPSEYGEPITFHYTFKIGFDESELEIQSNVFCDEVRSNPTLSRVVDLNINGNYEQKNQIIRNCYKYSAIKTLSLIHEFQTIGVNGLGPTPTNSLVFKGHKELFLLFVSSNVFYHRFGQKENSQLNKLLLMSNDVFDEILNTDIYKECKNDLFPGYINSPIYERLLKGFMDSGTSISVEYLDSGRMSIDPQFTPLGNMCFRDPSGASDVKVYVDSVTVPMSHTDHVSKFWNLANFIYIDRVPDNFIFGFNYPYISISFDGIPPLHYFAQVESITGLECGNKYSRYGSNSIGLSGYSRPWSDPSGSGGSNPSSGTPGKPGNGNNPKRKPPNEPNGGNNKPKNKNKLSKVELDKLKVTMSRAVDSGLVKNLATFAKDASLLMFNKYLDNKYAKQLQREALENSGFSENEKELYTRFGILGSRSRSREVRPLITDSKEPYDDSWQ